MVGRPLKEVDRRRCDFRRSNTLDAHAGATEVKRLSAKHRMQLLRLAIEFEQDEKHMQSTYGPAFAESVRAQRIKDAEALRAALEWIDAAHKGGRGDE
jgi:hypothetical protein